MSDETEHMVRWTDLDYERAFEHQRVLFQKKRIALRRIITTAAWDIGCPDPEHYAKPGEACRFTDLGPVFPEDERITGSVCPTRLWAAEDALK
jgi:hypothetical protein